MINGLDWTDLPRTKARDIMAQLLNIDDQRRLLLKVSGYVSPLPFYKTWRLVWLTVDPPKDQEDLVLEDVVGALGKGDDPILLDGSSGPVHEVNEKEELQLEEPQIADYIRWFCFAVTANNQPFLIWEHPPKIVTPKDKKALALIKPLTPSGAGDDGEWQYEGTVVFSNRVQVGLRRQGERRDADARRRAAAGERPETPAARITDARHRQACQRVPRQAARQGARRHGRGEGRSARIAAQVRRSTRPTIVELVELLLQAAPPGERGKPAADLLQRQPVDLRLPPAVRRPPRRGVAGRGRRDEHPVRRGDDRRARQRHPGAGAAADDLDRPDRARTASGVEVVGRFSLPGPAARASCCCRCRSIARAMQVERLAFDIAARDLSAIITCQRFSDLPESLRRYTDLVLRLPQLDARHVRDPVRAGHRQVRRRPKWRDGGTEWVKHVLHTDFEHPRRMQLPPGKAFAFVRAQVADRLTSVDPGAGHGLGLADLHGLGEGREWAEDLIADIHAAIAGQLPWSQVDRGALLVGPPGTGKTTLARAIAKGCGVKFIQGSAAGWMAEGVSLGPHISAIRKTFTRGPGLRAVDPVHRRDRQPRQPREVLRGDNNSVYQTEVINAVLEQIQGLDPEAPVFVIGATNHEDGVDPALRRAGGSIA